MPQTPAEVLRLQQRVLKRIAAGRGLDDVLDELCRLVEALIPGATCSIMVLDPRTGLLDMERAPGAPEELRQRFRGVEPSVRGGSCAAAVLTRSPVYVADTSADSRWAELSDLTDEFRLRACWSHPVRGENSDILGTFAISRDRTGAPDDFQRVVLEAAAGLARIAMTRHREAEDKKQVDARMLQMQKLEGLGLLAGGIAHDFNNLLAGVLGNVDVAVSRIPPDSPALAPLRSVAASARAAADLCRQMLAYAGEGPLSFDRVDLNRSFREVLGLLAGSMPPTTHLHLDSGPDVPAIRADATQVRQILMNLLLNASEALQGREGDVTVDIETEELSEGDLAGLLLGHHASPGTFVVLEVADDGEGMDEETAARVFDPFFTTKQNGRGLGMAAVQGIVRRHRGALSVRSRPGAGTRIRVYLPLDPAGEPAPADAPAERPRTILVVDDEAIIREIMGSLLESAGYEVVTASRAREVLRRLDDLAPRLACVILDLSMPDMDGHEAHAELRERVPGLPVIMTSGFAEADVVERFRGQGVAGFLAKPFDREQLLEEVARVLDGSADPARNG